MNTDKYILKIFKDDNSVIYIGFQQLKCVENYLFDLSIDDMEHIVNMHIYNCTLRHRSNYFKHNHKRFIKNVSYCGGKK